MTEQLNWKRTEHWFCTGKYRLVKAHLKLSGLLLNQFFIVHSSTMNDCLLIVPRWVTFCNHCADRNLGPEGSLDVSMLKSVNAKVRCQGSLTIQVSLPLHKLKVGAELQWLESGHRGQFYGFKCLYSLLTMGMGMVALWISCTWGHTPGFGHLLLWPLGNTVHLWNIRDEKQETESNQPTF